MRFWPLCPLEGAPNTQLQVHHWRDGQLQAYLWPKTQTYIVTQTPSISYLVAIITATSKGMIWSFQSTNQNYHSCRRHWCLWHLRFSFSYPLPAKYYSCVWFVSHLRWKKSPTPKKNTIWKMLLCNAVIGYDNSLVALLFCRIWIKGRVRTSWVHR